MEQIFAMIIVSILVAVSVFQLALIAGAPLGEFAWGGQHRILPKKLRISSIVSLVIYLLISLITLDKVVLIDWFPDNFVTIGFWVITIYFGLGVVMNAISRSKKERLVMTPVVLTLFLSCLAIALG